MSYTDALFCCIGRFSFLYNMDVRCRALILNEGVHKHSCFNKVLLLEKLFALI